MRSPFAALVLVSLVVGLSPASAEIYGWVDAQGTSHYTDRVEEVPAEARDRALGAEQLAEIPFNEIEGLDVLPGEADGTDAGRSPALRGASPAELKQWLAGAGVAVLVEAALSALVMFGLVIAFGALLLQWACRLVGQEISGFKKAYGIVIVQMLAGALAAPGLVLVAGVPDSSDLAATLRLQVGGMALSFLVNALVLRGMLTRTLPRAFGVAAVTVLLTLAVGLVLGVLVAIGLPLLGAIFA